MTKRVQMSEPVDEKELQQVQHVDLVPTGTNVTDTDKGSLAHSTEGDAFKAGSAAAERKLLWKMGASPSPSFLD